MTGPRHSICLLHEGITSEHTSSTRPWMSDTPVAFTLQISRSPLRLPGLLSRQPLEQAVPGHPKVGSLTPSRFRFFFSTSKEGGIGGTSRKLYP